MLLIDGPTLNIFAEDEAIGMPVCLSRRPCPPTDPQANLVRGRASV